MWYKAESDTKPQSEDLTSSKVYNYARKNIEEIQTDGGIKYVYEEIKVAKNDWWLFKQNEAMQEQLSEQADALVELASIIAEV